MHTRKELFRSLFGRAMREKKSQHRLSKFFLTDTQITVIAVIGIPCVAVIAPRFAVSGFRLVSFGRLGKNLVSQLTRQDDEPLAVAEAVADRLADVTDRGG